ncbi:MAG: hypothetical protein ACK4OM_07075 [Alphaproteobacteria bacterium]
MKKEIGPNNYNPDLQPCEESLKNLIPQSYSDPTGSPKSDFSSMTSDLYSSRRQSAPEISSSRKTLKIAFTDQDALPSSYSHTKNFRKTSFDGTSGNVGWKEKIMHNSSPNPSKTSRTTFDETRKQVSWNPTIVENPSITYRTRNNRFQQFTKPIPLTNKENLDYFQTNLDSTINSIAQTEINFPLLNYSDCKKVLSYRPAITTGKLHMEAGWENLNDEHEPNHFYLSKNLGHGGSGYTVGPGTVKYLVNEFIDRLRSDEKLRDKILNTGIAVVGAGIIGMMTANLLDEELNVQSNNNNDIKKILNQRIKITVYYNEKKRIPSNYAGAIIGISGLTENNKDLKTVFIDSCDIYDEVVKGPENQKNIYGWTKEEIIHVKSFYGKDTDKIMELSKATGRVKSSEKNIVINGKRVIEGVMYEEVLFIHSNNAMDKLWAKAVERGIELIEKTVTNFADLEQKAVFDSSGSGRINGYKDEIKVDEKYLNPKSDPIAGNILLAKTGKTIEYAFADNVEIEYNGKTFIHRLQVFPKNIKDEDGNILYNLMIGGTTKNQREVQQDKINNFDNFKFMYWVYLHYIGRSKEASSEEYLEFKDYKVKLSGTEICQDKSFVDKINLENRISCASDKVIS